jgi:hypothetical protein
MPLPPLTAPRDQAGTTKALPQGRKSGTTNFARIRSALKILGSHAPTGVEQATSDEISSLARKTDHARDATICTLLR